MRRLLVVLAPLLVTGLFATPALAAPPPGTGVEVAALVERPDGSLQVRRGKAGDVAAGRALAGRWRAERGVVAADVAVPVRAFEVVPASDPLQKDQWGLTAVKAVDAWRTGDASGQVIAVIDSGADLDHPDLRSVLVRGRDLVEDDSTPQDENGHGTHVAGIAAGVAGNGVGGAGAGLRAKIMPVRVLDARGGGSSTDVAEGIVWAVDNGATVINLSLGGPDAGAVLEKAVSYALSRGVPVVAASGNEAESGNAVTYPAAYSGVLAVGAVDTSRLRAPFSNYGSYLDLVAPGVGVLSTVRGGGYGNMSGTSMATPFVAAAAAVVRATGPTLSATSVRSVLVRSAVDVGAAGYDPEHGYGLVDMAAAATRATPTSLSWNLRRTADAGTRTALVGFGADGDVPLACDVDGDGIDTLVTYRDGRWRLRSRSGAITSFSYGDRAMRPVCGDWDGDGKDGIGVFDDRGYWWLRETATPGAPNRYFQYGWGSATPVVGRWTASRDGVGVFERGRWYLRRSATSGTTDAGIVEYGWSGVTPVPGDWDGNGTDTLGIRAGSTWAVRNAVTSGGARWFDYGLSSDRPVVGEWEGSGGDGVAVTR